MDFNEIMQNIDWVTLITTVAGTIWTVVLVPIGKELYDWLKAKRLDNYAKILYDEVVKAAKSVQEAIVKDLKGTDGWNEETQAYVRELCKDKAIQALSTIAYRTLKEANEDFNTYLDSLVDTALFDIKNGLR